MTDALSKMHQVLTVHDGHTLRVGGAWSTTTKTVDLTKSTEELGWQYLGYAVDCFSCGTSLSQEWNA